MRVSLSCAACNAISITSLYTIIISANLAAALSKFIFVANTPADDT